LFDNTITEVVPIKSIAQGQPATRLSPAWFTPFELNQSKTWPPEPKYDDPIVKVSTNKSERTGWIFETKSGHNSYNGNLFDHPKSINFDEVSRVVLTIGKYPDFHRLRSMEFFDWNGATMGRQFGYVN
jgi:hypothetical protein